MSIELKNKLNNNARHLRFISRVEMFQRHRKLELDYLQFYSPDARQLIQRSLRDPVPHPLPPITPNTISFYRRTKSAIFKPRPSQDHNLDAHMTYQSLWMLAGVQQKYYDNYATVVKQFQRDLALFLSGGSVDIRQLAIIAAGNKIIGKEEDILKLAQQDPRQIWVLANHIYQKKISYKRLFQFMHAHHEIAYKTLFQLSNATQDGITQSIVAEKSVLENLFSALNSQSIGIQKYAIRILGNVAAEKSQHVLVLHSMNVLDYLAGLIQSNIAEMRRDVCWLISNLICEKSAATKLLSHQSAMCKLVQLFYSENTVNINLQLTQIFISLAHYAEQKQAYKLLAHPKLLQICLRLLHIDDNELNNATLFLLQKLIELGQNCCNEDNSNQLLQMIGRMGELRCEIQKKSYYENNDVSTLSDSIMRDLEDEGF